MKSKILILLSASALVVYFNVDKLSAKLAISLALVFFVSILSLAISETKEREASSVEKYEKIKRRLLKAKVGIEEVSGKELRNGDGMLVATPSVFFYKPVQFSSRGFWATDPSFFLVVSDEDSRTLMRATNKFIKDVKKCLSCKWTFSTTSKKKKRTSSQK